MNERYDLQPMMSDIDADLATLRDMLENFTQYEKIIAQLEGESDEI